MSAEELDTTLKYLSDLARAKAAGLPPRRVTVFLADRAPAGFVLQNAVAAWIIRHFPGARACALYRDEPPWKSFLVDCNPHLHTEMRAGPDSDATALLDWFDIGRAAPVTCPDPAWRERGIGAPDLLLVPGMLAVDAARVVGFAENPPALRLPAAGQPERDATLARSGIDPARWFACVAMAADGLSAALVRHIVDRQGGQILVVDTNDKDFDVPRRAAAVARARYVVGDDPATIALASAFRTPAALIGKNEGGRLLWNRGDILLARTQPTAADLVAAADALFAASADCPGWRQPAAEAPLTPTRALAFPLPLRAEPMFSVMR